MYAVLVLDLSKPAWPVLACSERVCRLTGFDRAELIGRVWPPLWGATEYSRELEVLRAAIEEGSDCQVEIGTVHRDREPFASTVTVHPGMGEHGVLAMVHVDVESGDERWLAYHDVLTGLPNRRMLGRELEIALARAIRHRRSVALLFVDLDDFKRVNDELGHNAGDELLQETADRLRRSVRAEDLVFRLGGDEFIVVVTDIEGPAREWASTVAGHLKGALEDPVRLSTGPRQISASIGVSLFPQDASDAERLLAVADTAMYGAKRNRPDAPRRRDPPSE